MANAWKKIRVSDYATTRGREPRKSVGVVRNPANPTNARFLFPAEMATASRADVYSDGNGKLAVRFTDSGEFSVFSINKSSVSKAVTVPSPYVHMIPFGTRDVQVAYDGGMVVVDTAQF